MYCINFSGGNNKTHDQVERALRIDSFDAMAALNRGTIFANGGGQMVPIKCWHSLEYDGEMVELARGDILELDRIPNHFGGSRTYWLCPRCRRRARYLYFKGQCFQCRECSKLNYASQQRTKDCTNYARDGLKLARERLGWEPAFDFYPAIFPYVTPDKPKGMHWATYDRYLAKYKKYQEKYRRDSLREMLAILGR